MEAKKHPEKRQVRSYKVIDKFYYAAQKIAAQKKTAVANLVEEFIISLSKSKK